MFTEDENVYWQSSQDTCMDARSYTSPILVAVGLFLVVMLAVEVGIRVVTSAEAIDVVGVVNVVMTFPFLAMLLGVGYALWGADAEELEHARIVSWVLGGTALFFSFFLIIALLGDDDLFTQIQTVRWAIAAGAGSGALVGFFEFRAIERALAQERVQEHNEDLQDEKARLDEFASIISHDLRNPLNVAEGYLELLAKDYEDERFDRIERAHDRMHQIIEDTLILARTEHEVDEPEPVDIGEIVEECWETTDTADANIEIVGEATIAADPQHVRRLFENLIRNAVEHAGEDVNVRVTVTPEGFMFEDDGPGIPPDRRADVFEAGHSTSEDGIGFGLRIVQHVAEAHGWEIELTEGDDGGARFDITDVEFLER